MTALVEHTEPPAVARPARRAGPAAAWPDLLLVAGAGLLALAVRWPHLWTIPRFTDETLEVLHSLAIVRDGARPLTNYDSYYGALYNYLVALALALSGESPLAPRVVVLVAGVLTVGAAYLLGIEVARRLVSEGSSTAARTPVRLAGLLAAGLLATNGAHVVVNSHVAWSNCLTPLFTTLGVWALLRATRRAEDDPRSALRWALPLAGLLFGLALQTHPLVVALLPGAAVGLLIRDWRLLRSPWLWAGLLAFVVGYANMLAFNAQQGFESVMSAQRMRAEYAEDQQAAAGYGATAGAMGLLLARIVGGAVDQRDDALAYLADPAVLLVGGLAALGLVVLAARREPLPLAVVLSFLAILPAANPKFQTLITSRYLMAIVPLLFAAACAALVWLAAVAGRRWPERRRLALLAAFLAGLLLVALPLAALDRYYARALARSDTNERIVRLVAEIQAARRPDEVVLVDEGIGSELPDTGVTEVRGFEYLLTVERVPYKLVRPSAGRLLDNLDERLTALAVLNARDAAAAASRLRVEPLDPRPPAETGRMFDFRLYRLGRERG